MGRLFGERSKREGEKALNGSDIENLSDVQWTEVLIK